MVKHRGESSKMGLTGPFPQTVASGLQVLTRSQAVGAAHEERGGKQDEREVGYYPRAKETQSGAPIGKRSHKERLTMVETRLVVLEASLEELYQGQRRLLGVESLQDEVKSRIDMVESRVDRLTEDIKDPIHHLHEFIEVRPGIVVKDESGNIKCTPIYSRIVSLYAEQNELQFAVPGGLIGVGTTMDPTLTRADRLVGQVLGEVGSLPDVFVELEVNFFLLRRLLGVRTKGTEKQGKVSKLTKGEILMLNIGSMSTGARVVAVKNDLAKLQLTAPVCTSKGEKIALSRRVEKHWRLIGWGQIQAGGTLEVPPCPI
ncbi:hypothetical protein B296_00009863 [Ensete ventricosum]|uniref:Initiation factor eIF2 gamma C-terminal domain-containing protein n=1 Tax=Ensete ventricosum TaxID=4639 RepID=A0A427B7X5_ENSVE|nr:hypothetical protein B296_00009863 [Ensete ventricosum]